MLHLVHEELCWKYRVRHRKIDGEGTEKDPLEVRVGRKVDKLNSTDAAFAGTNNARELFSRSQDLDAEYCVEFAERKNADNSPLISRRETVPFEA